MSQLNINKPFSTKIIYILSLFFVTRIALTIIGVLSRKILEPFHGSKYVWVYSKHLWLDIWGVWDTGWYLDIASNWYSTNLRSGEAVLNQANYGFFPLYPLMMKIFGLVVLGKDYYLAGILISNISLIVGSIFLYKLVLIESDNETALKSVKYLYLFPTAFILSGVFTESLFLTLSIVCFYYAAKRNWLVVGMSGFLLALTRYIGVLVLLPLLYEYLKTKNFKFKNIKADILFLLFIPLGLSVYLSYCYYLTGDFLAYMHIHRLGWGNHFVNPLKILFSGISGNDINNLFSAYFTLTALLALIVFYKKIGFSYFLLGMYSILLPLSADNALPSISRYALVIFPFFILFAKLGKNDYIDKSLTLFLALLQGCLMVFWSNGFSLII